MYIFKNEKQERTNEKDSLGEMKPLFCVLVFRNWLHANQYLASPYDNIE